VITFYQFSLRFVKLIELTYTLQKGMLSPFEELKIELPLLFTAYFSHQCPWLLKTCLPYFSLNLWR